MRKFTFLLVMTLLLGGCAGYTMVKGGQKVKIGDAMITVPSENWNKISDGNVDIWTLDGPLLQKLIIVKGAEDGDYLMPVRRKGSLTLDTRIPRFEKHMSSIEVVELFQSTLKRMGAHNTEITNIRPYDTGKTEGFRFEFSFLIDTGLKQKGSSYGILKNNRLYMLIYIGTELHYFDKGKKDFEGIIHSLYIL